MPANAEALCDNDIARAQLYGLQIPIGNSLEDWQLKRLSVAASFLKAGFDPNQPRAEAGEPDGGQWIDTGGANSGPDGLLTDIAYPGDYHDALVKMLADMVKSSGGVALTEVPLTAVDGTSARADMIVRPKGSETPFVVEVKTGSKSSFTAKQIIVYELLPVGGHVTASKLGLEALGLASGQPLPPLRLLLIYSARPGEMRAVWYPFE